MIHYDADAVSQCVIDLLSNAAKYVRGSLDWHDCSRI